MDITTAAGATAFQQAKLANEVQTSVAAKTLDAARQSGATALQLLQSASSLNLPAGNAAPTNVDVSA
jgi:hypothetical protein